jgi:cytidylate kinase
MAELVVTIDGPAGSGKSTVARLVAQKLEISFLDTGAMYRAVTLAAMQEGVDLEDESKLLEIIDKRTFEFEAGDGRMRVLIDGEDMTAQIRGPVVTSNAKHIAVSGKVRKRMVDLQRKLAERHGRIVTEGRDQGSAVFPDADVKIYLTASVEERARRRYEELRAEGSSERLAQTRADIERRDKSDREREINPLVKPDEAVVIDTTDMCIEEVVEKIAGIVESRCGKT